MIIKKTGIYDIPEADYHKDCCVDPSLSQSIAKVIYQGTPYHGWLASQRLNKEKAVEQKDCFDVGNIAHSLFLEGHCDRLKILDFKDWRTNAAKEAREASRKAGFIPLLPHVAEPIIQMAKVAREKIEQSELAGILNEALIEQSFFAKDEMGWKRGRLDLVSKDRKIVMEYKTARSANPEEFVRSIFKLGYDIQAAGYRKLNYLTGGEEDSKHVWFVQEKEPPYLCSIIGAAPVIMEIGQRKLDIVEKIWKECLERNVWPDYGNRIIWAEAPDWELSRLEEREHFEMNKKLEEGCQNLRSDQQ